MTNSREKFKAWFEKQYGCAPMRDTTDDEVYIGWLAGRESMRDEAADFLKPKRPRSCDCDVCDCGNSGNLADVTSWDCDMFASNAVRSIQP